MENQDIIEEVVNPGEVELTEEMEEQAKVVVEKMEQKKDMEFAREYDELCKKYQRGVGVNLTVKRF